jgi:hypothetical protein
MVVVILEGWGKLRKGSSRSDVPVGVIVKKKEVKMLPYSWGALWLSRCSK